jgi:hypothetical protein
MKAQMELFPFEPMVRSVQANALREMLWKIDDAYSLYASHFPSRMYAHVVFIDGDTPSFEIVPEFWPDMACTYMDEAHPSVVSEISAR